MIVEYHRPQKMDEALKLLSRKNPVTRPLGGGTVLTAPSAEQVAVVDIGALGLERIQAKGKTLRIGAAARLQTLLDMESVPEALRRAIRHENAFTLRQMSTVAGSLVAADGRSPFAIAMLGLDAQLELQPGGENKSYGDVLPLRAELLAGRLITQIALNSQARLAYEYVARSPADLPLVAVALARWPSGRTRLAVGGFGDAARLAFDGQEDSGLEDALRNTLSQANDEWAGADYRSEAALALLSRAQNALEEAGQ